MNEQLRDVVAKTLELTPDLVTQGLSMENCGHWTSLAHVELMTALEAEFAVTIDEDEIFDLLDLASIEAFLARHGFHGA